MTIFFYIEFGGLNCSILFIVECFELLLNVAYEFSIACDVYVLVSKLGGWLLFGGGV